MKTRTSLLILSVALSGLLAGCNNDNDATDDTLGADTAATMPEGTTTPGIDDTMPADTTMGNDAATMGVQTGPITDTGFYAQATQANQKEIAAGTMATGQATDQAVKDYAQMLVTDHTSMAQQRQDAAGTADAAAPAPDPTATASD